MIGADIKTFFIRASLVLATLALSIAFIQPIYAFTPIMTDDVMGGNQKPFESSTESTNLIRWKPCGTIEYVIDVTDAPIGWVHDIHDAFRAASVATGIPVRYAGRWPHGQSHSSRDPVLVYYKYDKGFPQHNAIAYTQMDKDLSGHWIIGGYIIVDPEIAQFNHRYHRRTIFHEVGHAFGLPHPGSRYYGVSVMGYANAPYKPFDLWMFKFVGRQPIECR